MSEQAPFIPANPDEPPTPPAWSVFKAPGFTRLWTAQVISSLGDWIALVAILSVAGRVSTSTAIGLVMIARMLPGFVLAPIGGALVDRWNRKVVMVSCDIGRAGLLAILPFLDNLTGLIVLSFLLEVLTLLWSPAKEATVPNIVKEPQQLAAANSLSLVAAYGTFPLGAIVYAAFAGLAAWLGDFSALDGFGFDNQESLGIWFAALTKLLSALLISGLVLATDRPTAREHPAVSQTFRDVGEGLTYIRSHSLVRGVMVGLAGGLIGGGALIPLGPVFASEVLGGSSATFGLLMTALGVGAAFGVVTLLAVQGRHRVPRETVFTAALVTTGVAIVVVGSVATLSTAFVLVVVIGATAGSAYVTGFTLLQETVSDELRGRTFATLYTVVRLCLLLSLTVAPFIAGALGAISDSTVDGEIEVGSLTITLPGVRLALWLGGIITILAGLLAHRRMRRAHQTAEA